MPNSETQPTKQTEDLEDGVSDRIDQNKPVMSKIELYRPGDDADEWKATQPGLEIVGTGDLAARAAEDFARQVAEAKEDGRI